MTDKSPPPLPRKKPAVFHHPLGMPLYDAMAMDLHAMTYAEPMLAEIERLRDEAKRLRAAVVRAMEVGQQLGRCDAEIKAGQNQPLTSDQIEAEVKRRFQSSAELGFAAGARWAAEKLGGAV